MRRGSLRSLSLAAAVALAGACMTIAGCGQSGPLYLPPPKAKPAPSQTARTPSPATGSHLETGPV